MERWDHTHYITMTVHSGTAKTFRAHPWGQECTSESPSQFVHQAKFRHSSTYYVEACTPKNIGPWDPTRYNGAGSTTKRASSLNVSQCQAWLFQVKQCKHTKGFTKKLLGSWSHAPNVKCLKNHPLSQMYYHIKFGCFSLNNMATCRGSKIRPFKALLQAVVPKIESFCPWPKVYQP